MGILGTLSVATIHVTLGCSLEKKSVMVRNGQEWSGIWMGKVGCGYFFPCSFAERTWLRI